MNITGKRILAFFIDLVILSAVGAVVMFGAILLFPQQNISLLAPLFNVVNLLITLLFLFREKLGISLGKRAMQIKTVCADRNRKLRNHRQPKYNKQRYNKR